ncbi:proline-, glutamic acid- and leucine-rich protein 1 isoform X1 [Ixodes scapularis]|uniref:proline-, glutamic acid- and leucine-rich protein 1 isoform X1 n=1 Tax=Ixodes scapularis TaxID=6945 RepID=UPI001C393C04|nr:proline-, glutamic acid- and leucine-rich protein 1 isoform X1 [Ixodes scapularis]
MFTLLERSFDSKQSPKSKLNFLEASYACSDYFGQADITPKFVAAKVKTLLQSHKTSYDGLLLLDCYLSSFPTHVAETDGVFWTRSVIHLLAQGKRHGQRAAAWRVLERLLRLLADQPDQAKEAANLIPALMEKICVEVSAQDREPEEGALRCLLICMKDYGRLLGSIQDALEKFLLRLLVSWNSQTIQELVCECVSLLPACRRGGPKAAEAWLKQVQRLLVTAHVSLDKLFEDLHQVKSRGSLMNTLPLEMPLGSEDSHQGTLLCWRRIVGIIRTICFMLGGNFHQTVSVPTEDILHLLQRVLETRMPVMGTGATAQANLVAAILPSIQYEAVQLLCQLMRSCRQVLLRDAGIITELIEDVILRTRQDSSCDMRKLRQAGYGALCLWLQTMRTGVGLRGSLGKLLPVMLQDAESVGAATVELSSRNIKHQESRKGHVKVQESLQPEVRAQLCEQALKALSALISTYGTVMEPDALREVQSSVIHLLLRIQQQLQQGSLDALCQPYHSPSCRQALYALLLTLLVHPHPGCPPTLSCTVRLFSAGQRDSCIQVAELCRQGLACCSLAMHPRGSAFRQEAAPAEPLRCNRAPWRLRDAACQTAVKTAAPAGTQTTPPATPVPTPVPTPMMVLPQKRRVLTPYRAAKRDPGNVYQALSDEEELLSDADEDYLELRGHGRDSRTLQGPRVNGQGNNAHHPLNAAATPANVAGRAPKYVNAEDSTEDEECSDEEDFDEDDEEGDYMEAEEEPEPHAELIELESDEAQNHGKSDDAMEERASSDAEQVASEVDPASGVVGEEAAAVDTIVDGDVAKEDRAEAVCGDSDVTTLHIASTSTLEQVESREAEADYVEGESVCVVLENHEEAAEEALREAEVLDEAAAEAIIAKEAIVAKEASAPHEVCAVESKEDDSPDVDGMLMDLVDRGHDK